MNITQATIINSFLPTSHEEAEKQRQGSWTPFQKEIFTKIKKIIPNLSLEKNSLYSQTNDIHFQRFLAHGIGVTKYLKEYILEYGPIFSYNPKTKKATSWSKFIWNKEPAELLELLTLIYELEDKYQIHSNPDFIFDHLALPEYHLDIFLNSHFHMTNAKEYPRLYRPYASKILELLISHIPPERINNKIYATTPRIGYQRHSPIPNNLFECLTKIYSTTIFINGRCRYPQTEHMARAGTKIITVELLDMLIQKGYKPEIKLSNIFGDYDLQGLLMTPDVQLKYIELYKKNAAPEYMKNKDTNWDKQNLEQYQKLQGTIFYDPAVEAKLRSILQLPN